MFATLLGPLPRPPLPDDAPPDALLDAVLELQTAHGLEPLTDGGWSGAGDPVDVWRRVSARTGGLVKAVVPGPFSATSDGTVERRWLLELAEAGCPWIEVHEPRLVGVDGGSPGTERFERLHQALTADLDGVHLSLATMGGSVASVGVERLLAGSYASLALDLVAGPDDWAVAVATPTHLGIVAGVVSARRDVDDGPEVLLWAAGYVASTGRRGPDRVGLGTAGSLAGLPWAAAAEKVRRLGAGARLAAAPREEQLATIDPRAIDARSAALGRYEPRPSGRRPRPGRDSATQGPHEPT